MPKVVRAMQTTQHIRPSTSFNSHQPPRYPLVLVTRAIPSWLLRGHWSMTTASRPIWALVAIEKLPLQTIEVKIAEAVLVGLRDPVSVGLRAPVSVGLRDPTTMRAVG